MSNTSKTNWAQIDSLTDEQIDASDVAPLEQDFFQRAKIQQPLLHGPVAVKVEPVVAEKTMPAKDLYHEAFVRALRKDGWNITHDPLFLFVADTDLLIDLGAERIVAAERGSVRIAVEIKSFLGKSTVQDLKEAAGQFMLYEEALKRSPVNVDRVLYLAVRFTVYSRLFVGGIGRILLESNRIQLVVFDEDEEEIKQWIPAYSTGT